ncbi:MAG: hypothetical protein ACI8Z9_002509 [Paraglaciecola sp.]|jgi:hypothetical protein
MADPFLVYLSYTSGISIGNTFYLLIIPQQK